jgi:hypothetical protein
MAGKRTKPINPFIQSIMVRHGCATLKQLAAKTGLPYTTLVHYADMDRSTQPFLNIVKMSAAFGLTTDEFLSGFLSSAS